MRERIEIAGGVLYVDSRLGEGTRIIARLPSNHEQSKGGPRRRPARESLLFRRLVLETEVCATSERRRQRANRNGEPLDQLHGTSLPSRASCPTDPMWYSLACRTPIWGTSGLTIGVPL